MNKFKIGDKVRIVADHVWADHLGKVGVVSSLVGSYSYVVTREGDIEEYGDGFHYPAQDLELIEEENEMKLWQDMTPEEKGALLLAHHEGKEIEYQHAGRWWVAIKPYWFSDCAYRVKPEPVVEVVVSHLGYTGKHWLFSAGRCLCDTHKVTFNVVDGEIDVTSIKMEKL